LIEGRWPIHSHPPSLMHSPNSEMIIVSIHQPKMCSCSSPLHMPSCHDLGHFFSVVDDGELCRHSFIFLSIPSNFSFNSPSLNPLKWVGGNGRLEENWRWCAKQRIKRFFQNRIK
jgi:hypothetical protein